MALDCRALTFATRDGVIPNDIAILEDAGDGLRAVGLDKALLAQERDGAAQLKVLAKALAVHRDAGIRALVVAKRCQKSRRDRREECLGRRNRMGKAVKNSADIDPC